MDHALRTLHLDRVHAHLDRFEWLGAARSPVSLGRRWHRKEAIIVFIRCTAGMLLLLEAHLLIQRILLVLQVTSLIVLLLIHISLSLG